MDCHRAILDGEIDTKDAPRWRANIVHLRELPRLEDAGQRLRRAWIAAFLQRPHKLRRGIGESMPRMRIGAADAEAMAAALTANAAPSEEAVPPGNAKRGLLLLEAKGCGVCHAFTGANGGAGVVARALPITVGGLRLVRGMSLAPDLRDTRDRTTRAWVRAWLLRGDDDGARVMPIFARVLSDADVDDIVAAVFDAPLAPKPKKPPPPRLPVLERPVRFAEVQARVFSKTCIHCHADDDRNLGVGGPGNSGGFGYEGAGLVLTSYERVQAGSRALVALPADAEPVAAGAGGPPMTARLSEHRSVFRPVESGPMQGLPLLVAQLRARQLEEADEIVDGVTGMPLGLPALSPEDLQLVETWVAQGRPR